MPYMKIASRRMCGKKRGAMNTGLVYQAGIDDKDAKRSLKQVQPICAGDDRTGQDQEKNEQNNAASHPSAGTTPPKAKTFLKPIKNGVEKRQL